MNKRLGDVAEIRMGYSFRSRIEGNPEGNWSVVQMKDIDEDSRLRFEGLMMIQADLGSPKQVLQKGDLVFRSRGQVNTAALVDQELDRVLLASPMLLVRPKKDVIPRFLQWWINTPATQVALSEMAEGTSVRMVSKESLQKLEVPIPPLEIQKAISELASMAVREQELLAELSRLRRRWCDFVLCDLANRKVNSVKNRGG